MGHPSAVIDGHAGLRKNIRANHVCGRLHYVMHGCKKWCVLPSRSPRNGSPGLDNDFRIVRTALLRQLLIRGPDDMQSEMHFMHFSAFSVPSQKVANRIERKFGLVLVVFLSRS